MDEWQSETDTMMTDSWSKARKRGPDLNVR